MRNKKAWIFWESRRKYWDYSVISLCVYGNPGFKCFRVFRGFLTGISWIRTAYGVSAMTRKWIVQGSGALIQYDARGSRPWEGW